MNRNLAAVDPGLSGGFAVRYWETGEIVCYNMPNTPTDLYEKLQELAAFGPCVVLMENVGKHRLGNSAQSSATFAKHVGHLEAFLIAAKLPTHTVTASNWMKQVTPGRPKGIESQQVRARKNYIKDQMQRKYPMCKVTLATADALGILTYLIQNQDQY